MARNELVPQDYCNMVIGYIMGKGSWPFNVDKVVKYCIKKTKVLDDGDEQQIEHIVRETLKTLTNCGYLDQSYDTYVQVKDVYKFKGFVMEDPKPKISPEMIDRLHEIDKNSQYLGDNL